MNLRFFTDDDGTRTLQYETIYGWTAVEEVSAADERAREREMNERFAERERQLCKEAYERSLCPQHRRALKDFKPE